MSATGSSLWQPERGEGLKTTDGRRQKTTGSHRPYYCPDDPRVTFPLTYPSPLPALSLFASPHPDSALISYLSRFQSFTDPSAAHEARLTSDWSRETPACGRKTIAPTLVLCPSANHRNKGRGKEEESWLSTIFRMTHCFT